MSLFNAYKKNSDAFLAEVSAELEKQNAPQKTYEADPDDWYPGVDKSGNGIAVIRFLPPIESERLPFVKWFSHSFENQANGRWYIENSRTTPGIDTTDPVGEFNKKLWDSTKDENHPNRQQASAQNRNLNFRANVYVISDSANPENNGQIKKFKFGKVIFDYINRALNPPVIEGSLEQIEKLNPFDLFNGASLKIVIFSEKKGNKLQRNYSNTSWKERGPLADEKTMEQIYNEIQSNPKWSLKQYIDPSNFKDYDALKKRLDFVLGIDTKTGKPLEDQGDTKSETQGRSPPKEQKAANEPSKKATGQEVDEEYFRKLME